MAGFKEIKRAAIDCLLAGRIGEVMKKKIKVRFYGEGDVVKAVCEKCKQVRSATFEYRDYKSPGAGKVVPNVLQAFCDVCGNLAAIPDQSVPKIRENLGAHSSPLEVRLPPQLEDVIYLLSGRTGVEVPEVTRLILGFYIGELRKEAFGKRIKEALESEFGDGRGTGRISLRILDRIIHGLDQESGKLGLNRSQLIKAMLVRAKFDLLDHADSKMAQRFYEAASLMAA